LIQLVILLSKSFRIRETGGKTNGSWGGWCARKGAAADDIVVLFH